MRTPVKYGVILAAIHLGLSAFIVLLSRWELEYLLYFCFVDVPVTMLDDSETMPWLFDAMSFPGDAGVTPFVVLGRFSMQ